MLVNVLQYLLDTFKCNQSLPELELTYFDISGLAESIRKTLRYGQVPFTDTRITREKFENMKKDSCFLYGQVPMLTVNDADDIVQSKAILRYAGRLTRMYPSKNPLNAAYIDQWVELHSEFWFPLAMNMHPEKFGLEWNADQRKRHRGWCIMNHIPKYLSFLDAELSCSEWLGNMNEPSIADFCWLPTLKWLSSGKFDGLPQDLLDDYEFIRLFVTSFENTICETDS
jgi:glutathione S-transferase